MSRRHPYLPAVRKHQVHHNVVLRRGNGCHSCRRLSHSFSLRVERPHQDAWPQPFDKNRPGRGVNTRSPGKTSWARNVPRRLLGYDRDVAAAINPSIHVKHVCALNRMLPVDSVCLKPIFIAEDTKDNHSELFVLAIDRHLLFIGERGSCFKSQPLNDEVEGLAVTSYFETRQFSPGIRL